MESVTERLATDDGLCLEKQRTSPFLYPNVQITTDPTRRTEPDDSKCIQLLTCIEMNQGTLCICSYGRY